jgi:hypothetical protein
MRDVPEGLQTKPHKHTTPHTHARQPHTQEAKHDRTEQNATGPKPGVPGSWPALTHHALCGSKHPTTLPPALAFFWAG